jgi:type 1 fimbriae regulatory protein FimB/type 1 fimbriae regulatory protein FimE
MCTLQQRPHPDAARKHSRYGHRDATAILITYRHGRYAPANFCELTWDMIELDSGRIPCGGPKTVSITLTRSPGKEIRALRQLRLGEPAKPLRLQPPFRRRLARDATTAHPYERTSIVNLQC